MAELSNVEKILVEKNGWKDRGDGTLLAPTGKVYDHEAGGTFAERHGLGQDYKPSIPEEKTTTTPASTPASTPEPNIQTPPSIHVEYEKDNAGNIIKGPDGKNVIKSFGVKYDDGTISYTGAGREGILEASRQRSQILEYNKYVNDNRTRQDFETDSDYNHFITTKNVRLGQGSYRMIGGLDGQSTLQGPGGIEISKGDAASIKQEYRNKSNELNLALAAYQRTPRVTEFGIQYAMENQGFGSSDAVYQNFYDSYLGNRSQLSKIVNGWKTAAEEQGLTADGKTPYMTSFIPEDTLGDPVSLEDFKTKFTFPDDPKFPDYESFKQNIDNVIAGKPDIVKQPVSGPAPIPTPSPAPSPTPSPTPSPAPSPAPVGGGTFTQPGFSDSTGASPVVGGGAVTPISSGESSLPTNIPTVMPDYTGGRTMEQLTSTSQQGFGGQVAYVNKLTGQRVMVTLDAQGNPLTYVPPGFTREVGAQSLSAGGQPKGGAVEAKIARELLDFKGPDSQLENFLASSPQAAARMGKYRKAMVGLTNKRMGANEGTLVPTSEQMKNMQGSLVSQTMQPVQATVGQITPEEEDFIGSTAGQTSAAAPSVEASKVTKVAQVGQPVVAPTTMVTPATVTGGVKEVTGDLESAQGEIKEGAKIKAEEQDESSVSKLKAAQGEAIEVTAPNQREIEKGELIDVEGNITGQAEKASKFVEEVQAATATPSTKATVKGQLEVLMSDFEGGETPAWAAGSMRAAMQTLSARGLGASSMAGQAVIQAAMESALPIAQMDAQTNAKFESMNLSNKQQMAFLAAEQRAKFMGQEFDQAFQGRVINASKISEKANMNFTAEQQIALENSRAANTMELSNLSNSQAKVMAEAAALANLDMANLNNRQQAAVQNAQNFLAMDMANLDKEQQTSLFKAQQNIAALFSDQASENAAAQFNASSENQTNQFFASLSSQVGQFNASQKNAVEQFNVNSVNALKEFNSNIQQQRDMFNAQNGLVVAQANAQWRQNIATMNTSAQNESNMAFAQTINALTSTNLDQVWQRERDLMSFAFTASESEQDRALQIILGDKDLEAVRLKLKSDDKTAKGALWTKLLFGI